MLSSRWGVIIRRSHNERWRQVSFVICALLLLVACGGGVSVARAQAAGKSKSVGDEGGPQGGKPSKTTGRKVRNPSDRGDAKPKESATAIAGISRYTSRHYELNTDLDREQARDLLNRLETMLGLISKYWGRPPSGVVEMYVVSDLSKWPAGTLDAQGLSMIEAGAGVTVGKTRTDGTNFVSKATVYAVADHGTPQHEAVHAYCIHAFGRVGPVWYAEGMAEMGQYWRGEDRAVHAHRGVIDYLRRSRPLSLGEIVNGDQVSGDSWQNYAWRWALCHLLANNPNYAPRFRPMGTAFLTGQPMSFETVYGSMADEIVFEYVQFLQHLAPGYRVDLCAWDWKAKFKPLNSAVTIKAKVEAARGWQPSRLTVVAGKNYEFETEGRWSVGKDTAEVDAVGDSNGAGCLEGVLMVDDSKGYRLGEAFALGGKGTFRPNESGKLYLRCRDDWAQIDDNRGAITVRLNLAPEGVEKRNPEESQGPPAPGDVE